MIRVSENIILKPILNSDTKTLFQLMKEIYPLAYSHFWEDKGAWYLNSQYSEKNILKELSQKNTDYYFVIYKNEIVGNFRIIWDEKLDGLSIKRQVKLHRLYLHQKIHGKGIGKQLVSWLEEKSKHKNYKAIWLDTMDTKLQAFEFYKNLGYQYQSHVFLNFELMHDEVRKMSQVYKKL